MGKTTNKRKEPAAKRLGDCFSAFLPKAAKWLPALFFAGLWCVLSVYEQALLFRINELSSFIFDDLYFKDMMRLPAGMLHYVSAFLVQFFYYPALGAAIYVLLLYAVYRLVIKVFALKGSCRLLALLPVAALLASNTQLGYWIFYLKVPGYYYMALLATLLFLSAMLLYKCLNEPLRMLFAVLWCFAGFPLMGAYALAHALLFGCYSLATAVAEKRRPVAAAVTLALAVVAIIAAPRLYYNFYTTYAVEYIYGAGLPVLHWNSLFVKNVTHESFSYWHWIYLYWVPFALLLLSLAGFCVASPFRGGLRACEKSDAAVTCSVAVFVPLFLWVFWYNDTNFRIENKQNKAMWENRWNDVAEYSRKTSDPTRQVVINKNIATLKTGKAGAEMFTYPDGSSDILAPMAVHLTQTGGKMLYYQYGKFNFCYRWCVEDAVEYGWRYEYLKHAARCMLLSGEYRLAQRYLDILKRTIFYRGWAEELEKYINEPSLIGKTNEFAMPLQLACYPDELAVDDSFVEAYLLKNFKFLPENPTPQYIEAALISTLIRKDVSGFMIVFNSYLNLCKSVRLPKHYQEGLLLFLQLDKGKTVSVAPAFIDKFVSKSVQRRLESFVAKTKRYPGMKEEEMAQYFEEFKDTYFYFYFFVRKIKTN